MGQAWTIYLLYYLIVKAYTNYSKYVFTLQNFNRSRNVNCLKKLIKGFFFKIFHRIQWYNSLPGPQNKKNSNFEVKMAPRNAVYEIQITQNNGLLSFVFARVDNLNFPPRNITCFQNSQSKTNKNSVFLLVKLNNCE